MSSSTLKNGACSYMDGWDSTFVCMNFNFLTFSWARDRVEELAFLFFGFPPTVTTIYDKVGRSSCPRLFIWRHERWKIKVRGPHAVTLLNWTLKFEWYIAKLVVEDGRSKDTCYNGIGSRHNNHIGFNCQHNWETLCDHKKEKAKSLWTLLTLHLNLYLKTWNGFFNIYITLFKSITMFCGTDIIPQIILWYSHKEYSM